MLYYIRIYSIVHNALYQFFKTGNTDIGRLLYNSSTFQGLKGGVTLAIFILLAKQPCIKEVLQI